MSFADWPFTELRVDRETIERATAPSEVIRPVWWIANIYCGPEIYERSLQPFSKPQRYVFAMRWYEAEVCNGGHGQFYLNSTGIVWRDALKGFEAAGIAEVVAIIEESARRFGSPPSLDWNERERQLDAAEVVFGDLNDRYFALLRDEDGLDPRIMRYVRSNAEDFMFHAWVRTPPPRPRLT